MKPALHHGIEPRLNPYDTTTPWAMLGDLHKLLLVTAYYMTHTTDVAARKVVLAEVGRIAATMA